MATIEEKYAKFLITDEMKKAFGNYSSLHNNERDHGKQIIVQTADTNDSKNRALLKESLDGKLV
mgnify:CR=1 FL=1